MRDSRLLGSRLRGFETRLTLQCLWWWERGLLLAGRQGLRGLLLAARRGQLGAGWSSKEGGRRSAGSPGTGTPLAGLVTEAVTHRRGPVTGGR